jgi:hypothetical protein
MYKKDYDNQHRNSQYNNDNNENIKHNIDDYGNIEEDDNSVFESSEFNNYYNKPKPYENTINFADIIGPVVLVCVGVFFIFLDKYSYFFIETKEKKIKKDFQEAQNYTKENMFPKANKKTLKDTNEINKTTFNQVDSNPKSETNKSSLNRVVSKPKPERYKPVKDISKYYTFNEEQLIEEIKDSLVHDYNYYDRNQPCTADKARDTLVYISKMNFKPKLLDTILTNGFAPKYTKATNTIALNSFVVNSICSPVNQCH